MLTSSGAATVSGSGADIWGRADEFHFVYRTLRGDGAIVARVSSIVSADAWAKAGVMIRANTTADAAHGFMIVSRGSGLAFQRRRAAGGVTTSTAASGAAPRWVKLSRTGDVLSAYWSNDGAAWTLVGRDTVVMSPEVLVGLAVTGHGATATASFAGVQVETGTPLPAGWTSSDIGAVGRAGSSSHSAGTFTARGAGADVWGTADGLQFVWRRLDADGEIVARVATLEGPHTWTKAGVMMRQSLDAGSAHAFMLVSVNGGVAFQRRTVTGGQSTHTSGGAGKAPRWLRLRRTGQTIAAAVSTDGVTWRTVGSDALSIAGPLHVGLAVTSHDVRTIATATFDAVTVR
jgi:regulation of enolase protein 1 (concanavalin A-like superfamily)